MPIFSSFQFFRITSVTLRKHAGFIHAKALSAVKRTDFAGIKTGGATRISIVISVRRDGDLTSFFLHLII